MEQTKFIFLNFIIKEMSNVPIPGDLNNSYAIPNINQTADTFISFAIADTSFEILKGLGPKLLEAFRTISSNEISQEKLNISVEQLATGFESYLKKIATVKYELTPNLIEGDANYKGLLGTTLGNLLVGKIDKRQPVNQSIPPLMAPIVTFSNTGSSINDRFYAYIRNVRNDIHVSKNRSVSECLSVCKFLITAYLIATAENIKTIKVKVDTGYKYLVDLKSRLSFIDSKHIMLDAEEKEDVLDPLTSLRALEWHDDNDDITEFLTIPATLENEMELVEKKRQYKVRKSISQLFEENNRFWLIGEPGSGKTTSLESIAFSVAKDITNTGYIDQFFPIFIKANQLTSFKTIGKFLLDKVNFSPKALRVKYGDNASLLILIDGLNEVAVGERASVRNQIEELADSEKTNLIISARKYGFEESFGFPVFELLPLSDDMIAQYVEKYVKPSEKAQEITKNISLSETRVIDLARNPLMLKMLIRVFQLGHVPENKGQLFTYFVNWYLARETKEDPEKKSLKELALSELAFFMRTKGLTSLPQIIAISEIKKEIKNQASRIDAHAFLTELLSNNLLDLDLNGRVIFNHELFLEFFCALRLNMIYSSTALLDKKYFREVEWSEPIIMLSGIIDEPSKLLENISRHNIILAGRAIGSGAKATSELISSFILLCERSIQNEKNKTACLTALLELGTSESLRVIIKIPTQFENDLTYAISDCQRPEIAVLKLLRFGLSGRNRVRQCLRVFYRKPISESILNSQEFSNAQIALLDIFSNVEFKDLELIDNIGISKEAFAHIKEIIEQIIIQKPLESAIWRKALVIAANNKFIDEYTEIIYKRILDSDIDSGSIFYSIYIVCSTIVGSSKMRKLSLHCLELCLHKGYYFLALKFFVDLNLTLEDVPVNIEEHYEKMAENAQISILLEYFKKFSVDSSTNINIKNAIAQAIKKGRIDGLLLHASIIKPYLENFKEDLKASLLESTHQGRKRLGTVAKEIRKLGLEDFFKNYGMIIYYSKSKNYGILKNVLTLDTFSFAGTSATDKASIENKILRKVVRYKTTNARHNANLQLELVEIELT